MSGNVWNPDQSNYPNALNAHKKKTDYSPFERTHPDDALNNQYIKSGAADDHERPLCSAVHDGVVCKRPVTRREGSKYCNKGRGNA